MIIHFENNEFTGGPDHTKSGGGVAYMGVGQIW